MREDTKKFIEEMDEVNKIFNKKDEELSQGDELSLAMIDTMFKKDIMFKPCLSG